MTLRDLTPRQRDLLIRRIEKQWNYWCKRPTVLQPINNESWFKKGCNEGIKAVLDILLTPKKDGK